MFSFLPRKTEPAELVGEYTPAEAARITALRRQYRTYPDRFKLDINYWRLEFVRWLVVHGYLDEWYGSQIEQGARALDARQEKYRRDTPVAHVAHGAVLRRGLDGG